MSEFEVYVFRSSIEGFPSRTALQRKWTSNSNRSRKKAKKSYECRDEQLAADDERSDKGTNGVMPKRKTVADEVIANSAFAQSPPSFRRKDLHLLPCFWKKLTSSNVLRRDGQAHLEFPVDFWKIYSTRIDSLVIKLQGIHEESPVRTMTCHTNTSTAQGQPVRHFLRADWRAFVRENHLQVGQQLLFTLAADSFFIVREVQQPQSS